MINILVYSIKKQFINPKKIYCIDLGIRRVIGSVFSEDVGKIYRNVVFIRIKKAGMNIYYWKNKGECDFAVQNKNTVEQVIQVSYNVKWTIIVCLSRWAASTR